MIELIDRKELQALIQKAQQNLDAASNPQWKLAYQQFILACSTLAAFEARASVPACACQTRALNIDERFDAEVESE